MSGTTDHPRGLGTEEERVKLAEQIARQWTPPLGSGPEAEEALRDLVRGVITRRQLAKPKEIYWVLDNYVSLRCHKSLSRHLKRFVLEEYDQAIEDGCITLEPAERHRFRERRRKARWADRKANADLTKQLAEALKCTIRYAAMLRKDGTTIPSLAQQMADVLGTDATDHLRAKLRTGRQVDYASWFMRLWVPGGTFRDFLQDATTTLPPNAECTAAAIREQQGDAAVQLTEIDSLEKLIQFCISSGISKKAPAQAVEIWTRFKLWKIELVAALATRSVKENMRTDSFPRMNHQRNDMR